MKRTDTRNRRLSALTAFGFTLVLIVIIGIVYDYYYEFNDDVLMKDILSGTYTGSPSALNVQMLSPVGAFISFFYRIIPRLPWYGIFLFICQYLCVWIVIYRAFLLIDRTKDRAVFGFVVILYLFGIFLPHLVFIHYSVTVAMMASAAVFWFYTAPDAYDSIDTIKRLIVPIILIIAAYQIRTEMLLLMFPYMGAALIAKADIGRDKERRGVMPQYIVLIMAVLVGMVISSGINRLSYSSSEWRGFLKEFDARTRLYDYQYIPEYDANKEFYDSKGISAAQVTLLENYDYGLDERIGADVLADVADHAQELRNEGLLIRLPEAVREYIYRVTHLKGGSYSVIVLIMYIIAGITLFTASGIPAGLKALSFVQRIVCLFVMRSVSWLYIIYGRRQPERITHSLYMIETVILAAVILRELYGGSGGLLYIRLVGTVIIAAADIILIPANVSNLNGRIAVQEKINDIGIGIDAYCKSSPGSFYYEDVYSTIIDGQTYNDKIFKNVDNDLKNYDLMGGWIMNSPIYRDKLAHFGINSAAQAILDNDNVYVICLDETGMGWLEDYYSDIGIDVDIHRTDTVTDGYGVYAVQGR